MYWPVNDSGCLCCAVVTRPTLAGAVWLAGHLGVGVNHYAWHAEPDCTVPGLVSSLLGQGRPGDCAIDAEPVTSKKDKSRADFTSEFGIDRDIRNIFSDELVSTADGVVVSGNSFEHGKHVDPCPQETLRGKLLSLPGVS